MSAVEQTTDPMNGDTAALLQKMADQAKQIQELTNMVEKEKELTGKLTEKNRTEMKQMFDTVLKAWVEEMDAGETAKQQFKQGLEKLSEQGDTTNGIWQVCCAASERSSKDRANAAEKERMYQEIVEENNKLQRQVRGDFNTEAARIGEKRQAESDPHPSGGARDRDIWTEFGSYMRGFDTQSFIPT
jgi:hypothetical protein